MSSSLTDATDGFASGARTVAIPAGATVSAVSEARVPEEDTIPPDRARTPPSRTEEHEGPTPEEEMRGAQPPNHEPGSPLVEHENRPTGKTADVVDVDRLSETGSGRSAQPPEER